MILNIKYVIKDGTVPYKLFMDGEIIGVGVGVVPTVDKFRTFRASLENVAIDITFTPDSTMFN